MRRIEILVVLVMLLAGVPAIAQNTWDDPLPAPVPYFVDSGMLTNNVLASRSVHSEVIEIPSARWMRLYFGDVELGRGSSLRITSEFDGEVQQLDAAALAMWSNTSGYFNGGKLTVELIAGPKTRNRLVIEQLASEPHTALPSGLGCDPGCCGPADDRVPSNELWSSRLLPAGCTASTYNTQSCAVSAGHCVGGSMVLEFDVPQNNPNCSAAHPPIADQFPVIDFDFTNGGVGNDWSALATGTNNLGETAFQRYGVLRPIASTPPAVGQPATVWGYGADDQCLRDGTQQTSDGPIAQVGGTSFRYSIDVTFGNSGSGVLRNGSEIVGIVTHCCCPNQGTRIDHPAFVAARDEICPELDPDMATLLSANVILGDHVSGSVGQLAAEDGSHIVVDANQGGPRYSTLTEVVAQSPFGVLSELNVRVVYGPADASPVFSLVQLFNFSTGKWNTDFDVLSTTGNTTIDLLAIPSPNSYLDGSNQIRIRVAATSRVAQTPGGFTKLIDHVEINLTP